MPEEVVRNTSFSGGIAMKYQFIHSFPSLFFHFLNFSSNNSTVSAIRTRCTPTLSLMVHALPFNLTCVVTSSYIALITDTIHSFIPSAHQTTSRGTLSNAFSKSTKAIHRSLTNYGNCICRAPPCHTLELQNVIFYNLFTLPSITFQNLPCML